MRRIAWGSMASLLLALPVLAAEAPSGAAQDPFQRALTALAGGDFDTGLPALETLAREGDVRAQDALAALYLNGVGVGANVPRAMQWYCRVAHHRAGGRPVMHAAWFLAEYFRTGGGVPGSRYLEGDQSRADPLRAYFWFSVMAAQARLYQDTHADSVTLGKMGMNAVGRELYEEEKAALARALSAWSPARPVASGEACLALPEGLEAE